MLEELDGFRNRHVEHVEDVLAIVLNVEHIALEALAVTTFALENQIGHELHLNRDDTRAFAFLASAAVGIEREVLGGETHLLGQGLVGKELADGIVSLHVRGGIGARALADGVLVDELHMADSLPVAIQRNVFARNVGHLVEMALQGRVEGAFDERRLAATADARYHRKHVERETHVDAFQVVHASSLQQD